MNLTFEPYTTSPQNKQLPHRVLFVYIVVPVFVYNPHSSVVRLALILTLDRIAHANMRIPSTLLVLSHRHISPGRRKTFSISPLVFADGKGSLKAIISSQLNCTKF